MDLGSYNNIHQIQFLARSITDCVSLNQKMNLDPDPYNIHKVNPDPDLDLDLNEFSVFLIFGYIKNSCWT